MWRDDLGQLAGLWRDDLGQLAGLWRDDLGQLAGVVAQLLGLSVARALCVPCARRGGAPATKFANAMILAVLGFACPRLEHSSTSIPPGVETHDDG